MDKIPDAQIKFTFFVSMERTIRCLVILFPSNRKLHATPHS